MPSPSARPASGRLDAGGPRAALGHEPEGRDLEDALGAFSPVAQVHDPVEPARREVQVGVGEERSVIVELGMRDGTKGESIWGSQRSAQVEGLDRRRRADQDLHHQRREGSDVGRVGLSVTRIACPRSAAGGPEEHTRARARARRAGSWQRGSPSLDLQPVQQRDFLAVRVRHTDVVDADGHHVACSGGPECLGVDEDHILQRLGGGRPS